MTKPERPGPKRENGSRRSGRGMGGVASFLIPCARIDPGLSPGHFAGFNRGNERWQGVFDDQVPDREADHGAS
jgi:hypothetical protein